MIAVERELEKRMKGEEGRRGEEEKNKKLVDRVGASNSQLQSTTFNYNLITIE